MTKIAFYANNMSERGSAVALYDYARLNETLLGNESLVIFDADCAVNNASVIARFEQGFETIPSKGFSDVDRIAADHACDLVHVLKSGRRDHEVSRALPTMVHAVFPKSVREIHGSSYAFVSEWLSELCSRRKVPWVPHVVSIGDGDDDMRRDLGIPADALVFGCYGGRDSFDVSFVRDKVIPQVLAECPSHWFIFMNIAAFIDHPRVLFLPGSTDMSVKTAFINTSDAMLHARRLGESFGLAVGEFSLRGKPVLTYGASRDRAHIDALGDAALIYRNARDLYRLLATFDRGAPSAKAAYEARFTPAPVMAQFRSNLIEPALRNGLDGARRALGLSPWHPSLIGRPKLVRALRGLF